MAYTHDIESGAQAVSDKNDIFSSDEENTQIEAPIEVGLPCHADALGPDAFLDDWADHPSNPYNWSPGRKWALLGACASISFLASIGTSIMSPAHAQIMAHFDVGMTVAMLPLSLYVIALAVGPVVIGGPLSETIGRLPIAALGPPLGLVFSAGAACVHSFAGLCVLRFFAGFFLSPSLAITSGVLTETFKPAERGLPVALFILTPFLGPGFGPVLGAFACRKGWQWTQWTLVFFAAFCLLTTLLGARETYHPVLRRRLQIARARAAGVPVPPDRSAHLSLATRVHGFLTVGLLRPLHMAVAEPIVGLTCLYVACEFATLFSFFAAVPYTFQLTYGFGREDSGLVFIGIVVGCLLGLATVLVCEVAVYQPKLRQARHLLDVQAQERQFQERSDEAMGRQPELAQVEEGQAEPKPGQTGGTGPSAPNTTIAALLPPEQRLHAAMVGSIGLPVGLFWFGWAADHHHAGWAAPAVAIAPFAWGNMCIFISLMQYMGDTYHGSTVASATSANSLARYALAGAFPLFTLQMYEKLGIGWASSLLGFIAVALMPVPWLFFRFGPAIRARSKYV